MPGHEVHWIQWKHASPGPWVQGTAVVGDDGWLTVVTDEGVQRLWTHETDRLAAQLDDAGRVRVGPASALTVGASWFSVGRESSLCPDPAEDLEA